MLATVSEKLDRTYMFGSVFVCGCLVAVTVGLESVTDAAETCSESGISWDIGVASDAILVSA